MGEDAFQGLQLRPKHRTWLRNVHDHCSFAGKRVLEIGSDTQLQAAQAMLRLGAREVVAVNPGFRKQTLEMHVPGITPVACPAEDLPYPDGSFDIIFGVALLEHVHNPQALALKCSKLLDGKHGFCFLQGSPVWTSPQGHHIICRLGDQEIRPDRNPPLEDWQHLCLETHDTAISAFCQRGFSHEEAVFLARKLLDDQHISRKVPTEILEEFVNLEGMTVLHTRGLCPNEKTAWYAKAAEKYSKEDLDTFELLIMMWHTRTLFSEMKEKYSCHKKMRYR